VIVSSIEQGQADGDEGKGRPVPTGRPFLTINTRSGRSIPDQSDDVVRDPPAQPAGALRHGPGQRGLPPSGSILAPLLPNRLPRHWALYPRSLGS
jgi:hypothetical protein